ncbi:MAG: alpha-ketoacid dehydrogenase subunit beta, partial [Elusimicrobia bacterium]|nr:alpha-ketoacid dehydrogenase subunit beta [Elusimicrobiota bacterium]
EIQFVDYIFNVIDMLKLAANGNWASGGKYKTPLVVMTPTGSGIHGSLYHSHSFDTIASKLHGMKVVCPSNALDAYGLLIAAIKSDDPVLYLKPKALMRSKGEEIIPGEPDEKTLHDMIDAPLGDRTKWKAKWPKLGEHVVEIGKAKISHPGADATVVTHGRMAPICLEVARAYEAAGKGSIEVIDLRSLIPYDWEAIKASVKKTGRVVFVNEETEITNFAEHLIRRLVDEMFYELKVRPRLLAGKATPGIALSPNLEYFLQPQKADVERVVSELLADPA